MHMYIVVHLEGAAACERQPGDDYPFGYPVQNTSNQPRLTRRHAKQYCSSRICHGMDLHPLATSVSPECYKAGALVCKLQIPCHENNIW